MATMTPRAGVDDCHHRQIAGEIALDVAHDLQKAQLGVAIAEHRDHMIAQLDLADEEEQQRGEEQQQFAGRRRQKGDHRQDEVRRRLADAERAVVAEQRGLQFAQRRQRLIEHGELLLDGGADLRRAPDPFAHRAGERRRYQAQRAKRDEQNEHAAYPGRNAVIFGELDQGRQRQRDNGGGEDRQHEGVADIEKGAEQQQEYADGRGLAGRCPNIMDIIDWRRIADDQRVADFAFGPDIFHKPSVAPRARAVVSEATPARAPGSPGPGSRREPLSAPHLAC